jgi:hypothetical protein
MTPVCPACGNRLHERAGVSSDARIAVSGGPAVGKTQLLVSAMAEMTGCGASPAWKTADEDTADWLRDAPKLIAKRPGPEHRPTGPVLLTLRDGTPPQQRYLHFIDVGGQHFIPGAAHPPLRHLATTCRHMLVLDPTTIPSVSDRMDPATLAGRHADDRGSGADGTGSWSVPAEFPYHLLLSQLNDCGARTRRVSLAVVVTKADLLAKQGLAPEPDPAATMSHRLRAWLCVADLRNLVEMAEHDFAEVRYFLVGLGLESTDPVAPFAWLLDQHRRGAAIP